MPAAQTRSVPITKTTHASTSPKVGYVGKNPANGGARCRLMEGETSWLSPLHHTTGYQRPVSKSVVQRQRSPERKHSPCDVGLTSGAWSLCVFSPTPYSATRCNALPVLCRSPDRQQRGRWSTSALHLSLCVVQRMSFDLLSADPHIALQIVQRLSPRHFVREDTLLERVPFP